MRFDAGETDYDATDLDDLALAWASTIHKSQGGEFPGVIVALHTQHYVLLQRTLLYTAITRARQVAVIVGSREALGMAVRNAAAADRRCTLLAERLAACQPYSGPKRRAGPVVRSLRLGIAEASPHLGTEDAAPRARCAWPPEFGESRRGRSDRPRHGRS